MQKPLNNDQILNIIASDPVFAGIGGDLALRLVSRIEWEHKIGDDPFDFAGSVGKRQKEIALEKQLESREPNQKKWTDALVLKLLANHRAGEKVADMADRLGLTRHRIYQLIKKAERLEKHSGNVDDFDGLSVRARNTLLPCLPERTLDAACKWYQSGEKANNMGAVTRYEIKAFLAAKGYAVSD